MATTSFPDASPRKHHPAAHPAPPTRSDPLTNSARPTPASRAVCTARTFTDDLVITAAEPEFARQFGLSAEEIRGCRLLDLLQPPAPAASDDLRKQFLALSSGHRPRFTERVMGRDGAGGLFHADITGVAVHGLSGETSGIVVLLRSLAPVHRPQQDTPPAAGDRPVLSALDAQVLEGVARGESTVQLASRLYLSRQGIEYRIGQMLRRFDTPNRPALVSRMHALGMFVTGQWPPRVRPDRVKP
ncbi:helix-turn-helix transcriptional regulator [Streptomyces sp. NPDC014991]|uniref:helix-turn-helix transcriptional regulator n=1 Tax=Streptomyces sp. NPDC014991 TaxID=3364935 RepID=UPI0036F91C6D